MNHTIKLHLQAIKVFIASQDLDTQVELLNYVKKELHAISPFSKEPVDCVLWVKGESVEANGYNPNVVYAPELKLLEVSISEDGYTQPIVTWLEKDRREVIDGFHRNKIGKESKEINERIYGYLPVVTANENKTDKGDRIASTIRHNRARGKHTVDKMSDIVIELKKRNWNDAKISKQLGMDEDEILRLTQITGLAEMFADRDFSEAWEVEIDSEEIVSEITEKLMFK